MDQADSGLQMTDSPLKQQLEACYNKPVQVSGWSIGHRGGGTLQIPEETTQSTEAGARMGAGVLECDVSFTSDLGLVCRHDICDLHTTTDILLRPQLAAKVSSGVIQILISVVSRQSLRNG